MNRHTVALAAALFAAGSSSLALAADVDVDASIPDVNYGLQVRNWDGPFVGVFGGYEHGTVTSPITFDLNGAMLGVNAGTNFTLENGVVLGVVGDIAWSNASDPDVIAPPGAFDVNWFGSVRGKVGYDAGAFMPYLTGGLAIAGGKLTASTGDVVASNAHYGWTLGAGVEVKATENIGIDVSYRYSDYGARAYGVTDWKFATHQITAGVNWHF
ncbi:outer membrane protein [Devosia soli]|uniref:outer membrane protein n=1 Tax=Devosia soli TaxID=361041 RepID=UPI00069B38C9|nr:outer membrane beta-barrel protein [Devosia soli]